jgi:TetR/AcrR family transcriptional regulator, tetracycline repressor protein
VVSRGRPKTPVLSRGRIIEAALQIVDDEGLDALTTRRLAADLGVKGASLYNHFRDKDEIVVAVAEYALTRVPSRMLGEDVSPEQLLLWGVVGLRDALLANPHLVPVLVRQRSVGNSNRDAVTARLIEGGVPPEDVMLLHESLERWAIGNAVRESTLPEPADSDEDTDTRFPNLSAAVRKQRATPHEVFETVARGIIRSILDVDSAYAGEVRREPAPAGSRSRRRARG